MEHTLHIRDLDTPTLTRARGREAYQRLRQKWNEGTLCLVLDGMKMLSLSFLDGLILELMTAGKLPRVIFDTRDSRTHNKLARLAGLHPEAVLYVKDAATKQRRQVIPAVIRQEQSQLETSKDIGP